MIVSKFAFYWEMGEPIASYLVLKSDRPQLPVGGNVDVEILKTNGEEIPETPAYLDWVKNGRKCYRGEGVLL